MITFIVTLTPSKHDLLIVVKSTDQLLCSFITGTESDALMVSFGNSSDDHFRVSHETSND